MGIFYFRCRLQCLSLISSNINFAAHVSESVQINRISRKRPIKVPKPHSRFSDTAQLPSNTPICGDEEVSRQFQGLALDEGGKNRTMTPLVMADLDYFTSVVVLNLCLSNLPKLFDFNNCFGPTTST